MRVGKITAAEFKVAAEKSAAEKATADADSYNECVACQDQVQACD
jgi:hypothetical protein